MAEKHKKLVITKEKLQSIEGNYNIPRDRTPTLYSKQKLNFNLDNIDSLPNVMFGAYFAGLENDNIFDAARITARSLEIST